MNQINKLIPTLRFWLFTLSSVYCIQTIQAEGTAQIRPTVNDFGKFLIRNNEDPQYTDFGQFGAPVEEQIRIRVNDTSETIYYGISVAAANNGDFIDSIPYRILSPTGVVLFEDTLPGPGEQGYINDYDEAIIGPNTISTGGYDPLSFQPTDTGDYVIEFYVPTQVGNQNLNSGIEFPLFDITVADSLNNPETGRLHSQGWQISTGSFTNPFSGVVYPYDPDGVIYSVDFNGMQPYLFVINFNSNGVTDNGSFEENRLSQPANVFYPEYEVFLSPPDTSLYPVQEREIGVTTEIIHQTCNQAEYCFRFTSLTEGQLEGFIDLNGSGDYEEGSDIRFAHVFTEDSLSTCIPWDGRDSDGNLINGETVNVVANIGFGATHLPLFDVEASNNGIKVNVVSPANASTPVLFWDDTEIDNRGVVGDKSVELVGCNTETGDCHTWSNRGQNNNDSETINTWWYADLVTSVAQLDVYQYEEAVLSFNPLDFIDQYETVCKEDTVDFYLFNQGLHPDTARYKYQWFFDGDSIESETGLSITHIVDSSYQVVVHSEMKIDSLCYSYDTLTVDIANPVIIEADLTHETCDNDNGTINVEMISGPEDADIYWNDSLVNSLFIDSLPDGDYHLEIISEGLSGRCNLDTTFTIDSSYSITMGDLIFDSIPCLGSSANASVTISNPIGPYTYFWNNTASSSSAVSGLSTGDQTLMIKDDLTGCEVDTAFEIIGYEFDFTYTLSPENCGSDDGYIEVNAPNPNINIYVDGVLKATNSFKAEDLDTGFHYLRLEHSLDNTCYADDSVYIDGRTFGIEEISESDITCYESSGRASFKISDSLGSYIYIWPDKPVEESFRNDLVPGIYEVKIVEELTGCTADTTIRITGVTFSYDVLTQSEYCGNGNAMIQVSSPDSNMYVSINGKKYGESNFIIEDLTTGHYDIELISSQDSTCKGDTSVYVEAVEYDLDVYFEYSEQQKDGEIQVGETVTFENQSDVSNGLSSWYIDGSSYGSNNFSESFTSTGLYSIQLEMVDDKGCTGEYSNILEVVNWKPCKTVMANAFSPNGDGTNDDIGVLGNPLNFDLQVYNRWGEAVFRSTDTMDRWDGIYRSEESPIGSYPFVLRYECLLENGEIEKNKIVGDISLLR